MERIQENQGLPKYCRRRPQGVTYTPYLGNRKMGKSVVLGPPDMPLEQVWESFNKAVGIKAETVRMRRARSAVAQAIKHGRLVRMPCEECGEPETHGHHDDYLKPLSVRWLCLSHHRQWHIENGRGINRGDEFHNPKKRNRCISDCRRCSHKAPHGVFKGDWCGQFERQPYGICEKFTAKSEKA